MTSPTFCSNFENCNQTRDASDLRVLVLSSRLFHVKTFFLIREQTFGRVVALQNMIFISASEYDTLDKNTSAFSRRLISLSTISPVRGNSTLKYVARLYWTTFGRKSAKFSRLRKGKSES